jgi:hypothetical protein
MVLNYSRYTTLYWSKKFLRIFPVTGTDRAHIFHNVMENTAAEKVTETPANIKLAKYGAYTGRTNARSQVR